MLRKRLIFAKSASTDKGQVMEEKLTRLESKAETVDTRLALLEQYNEDRHRDSAEMRAAITELALAVRELTKWQASMKWPLTGLGLFTLALITAAANSLWGLIDRLSG